MSAGAQLLDGLEPGTLEELDAALLLPNGRLRLMPTAELLAFGLSRLQAWCVLRARYQRVTRELVQWLSDRIAGRTELEIGAGMVISDGISAFHRPISVCKATTSRPRGSVTIRSIAIRHRPNRQPTSSVSKPMPRLRSTARASWSAL
jgi:hypothetical protein